MAYDWRRLGDALKDARGELDLTQAELAERSGVALSTIKNLEGARDFIRWPKKVAQVERALGWPPGRARAIASGKPERESVVPLPTRLPEPHATDTDPVIEEIRRERGLTKEAREMLIEMYLDDKAREAERRQREDEEREQRFMRLVGEFRRAAGE